MAHTRLLAGTRHVVSSRAHRRKRAALALAGWLTHLHGIQPTSHHEPESVSDLLYDLELVYLMKQDVF